jgi:hypothetical protein
VIKKNSTTKSITHNLIPKLSKKDMCAYSLSILILGLICFVILYFTEEKTTPLQNQLPIDAIQIKLTPENIAQLEKEVATNKFFFYSPKKRTTFPAHVIYKGKTMKAKVSLTGKGADHRRNNSWSLRINLKGDNYIMGANEFKLINLSSRGGSSYILLDSLFKEVCPNVISLPFNNVEVYINDQTHGIMQWEPTNNFDLLAQLELREGILARFDDNSWFKERIATNEASKLGFKIPFSKMARSNYNWRFLRFEPYKSKKINKNERLKKQWNEFLANIQKLQSDLILPSQILDVEKWTYLFAFVDITGVSHPTETHNLRFYYNPITRRIEPLVYDWSANTQPTLRPIHNCWVPWIRYCLRDPKFIEAYTKIWPIVKKDLAVAITNIPEDLKNKNTNPNILSKIKNRHENYKFYIAPTKPVNEVDLMVAPHAITLYARESKEGWELTHPYPFPLIILGANESILLPANPKKGFYHAPNPISSVPNHTLTKPTWTSIDIHEKTLSPLSIKIEYAGFNHPEFKIQEVNPLIIETKDTKLLWPHPFEATLPSWLKWDTATQSLILSTPKTIISKTIILPKKIWVEGKFRSSSIYLKAGDQLTFKNDAALITESGIFSKGTAKNPIKIINPAILSLGDSELNHTQITGGQNTTQWGITGSCTFSTGKINLNNITFNGGNAEDQLNTVKAQVNATNISFKNAPSDAWDLDFCKAKLQNIHVENIKGDGIDISGSHLELNTFTALNITDKALSFGEASTVTAKNITISRAHMGIVSKDSTITTVQKIHCNKVTYPYAVYTKKPQYSQPSELHVKPPFSQPASWICQNLHTITLDGNILPSHKFDSNLFKK